MRRKEWRKRSRYNEPTRCRFCREKIRELDYKDVPALLKLCTGHGKMFSRKRSGNCARHQRSAKHAIKRARYLALLSFVGEKR